MKVKKLLRSVGFKPDLSQIPTGFYCYEHIGNPDNIKFMKPIFKIIYCPYFKRNHKFKSEKITDNYCKLVKNKELDILLSDSCKICGIKMWSQDVTDI